MGTLEGDIAPVLSASSERVNCLRRWLGDETDCREQISTYLETNGGVREELDYLVGGSLANVLDPANPNSFYELMYACHDDDFRLTRVAEILEQILEGRILD